MFILAGVLPASELEGKIYGRPELFRPGTVYEIQQESVYNLRQAYIYGWIFALSTGVGGCSNFGGRHWFPSPVDTNEE